MNKKAGIRAVVLPCDNAAVVMAGGLPLISYSGYYQAHDRLLDRSSDLYFYMQREWQHT